MQGIIGERERERKKEFCCEIGTFWRLGRGSDMVSETVLLISCIKLMRAASSRTTSSLSPGHGGSVANLTSGNTAFASPDLNCMFFADVFDIALHHNH